MTNRIFTDRDGACWTRVSKRRARSAYEAGGDVIIAPVNIRLFGPWGVEALLTKRRPRLSGDTFDTLVNEYEYYNCIDYCSGPYAAFYVRSEALE